MLRKLKNIICVFSVMIVSTFLISGCATPPSRTDINQSSVNNPENESQSGNENTVINQPNQGGSQANNSTTSNNQSNNTVATTAPVGTVSQRNALSSAKSYLSFTSFSREGLIGQLEYEGYPYEDCVYAVDNCGADWSAQALLSAKSYLDYSSFSYQGLIDQLLYEGFTNDQAVYGVNNCGADWNQQAVEVAASYLSFMAFSRQGLIDQLVYEGFTYDQAVYGVTANGL